MKKSVFVIFLIFIFSCNEKSETEVITSQKNDSEFFDPVELGAFGSKTRLIIDANFDECGEWGGHEENFEIFSKEDKNFYAKFTRTKVDCDKVGELYGKPEFHQLDFEKEIKISKKEIKAIKEYISNLTENKISERFPGHSGQRFSVVKTDSTLVINVYDSNQENLENYNKLLKAFSISQVQ